MRQKIIQVEVRSVSFTEHQTVKKKWHDGMMFREAENLLRVFNNTQDERELRGEHSDFTVRTQATHIITVHCATVTSRKASQSGV